ncbi:hypothetical protein [Actinospica sp.]|nr:hypothetical protein [Actinospica sp.]HWG28617.1 hypothetical protein [Actinospica sp.]
MKRALLVSGAAAFMTIGAATAASAAASTHTAASVAGVEIGPANS